MAFKMSDDSRTTLEPKTPESNKSDPFFVIISIRAVIILHEARHSNGDFGVGAKPELSTR